jgi:TonB family protein
VDAVRNRVQQSWDQSTIQPAVRAARRAHTVMTFRINANGSISNIRVSQTSGDWSMDNSAQRALQSIDTFRPLPNDYMGSYVDVTFDFDLSMAQ